MKIAVIGSRTFSDFSLLESELKPLDISLIISGGAVGADRLAVRYANSQKIPCTIFFPDYQRFGKSAPIIRNHDIVKEADFVIAFWDSKSRGTLNAIMRAKKLRKKYKVIQF